MKHIIGLDIGTNSIGWVLLENNIIVDRGVIIFPIGTNVDKNGIESTKNMERRGYRGANRLLTRYKLRRKNLRKLIESIGMLPNFKGLNKIKDTYQSQDLYELRALAIDQKIPEQEIGRILLLINKHRGFKSNSKTLSKPDDEDGKVSAGIAQLETFMEVSNSRTIGEYFYKMHIKAKDLFDQGLWHNINEPYDERALNNNGEFVFTNSRGIRNKNGRYVGREMYESEFDLIWRKQKEFYRQNGFPTANLQLEKRLLPRRGVYVSRLWWKNRAYSAVTNVGKNPTFTGDINQTPLMVETHVFDFSEYLYGDTVEVEFLKFLRDEQRFNGVDALVAQIQKDCDLAREFFRELKG
jgi:CRISPR/Cas system Type II protein with McrA/HNH and RuvC-like nuclease domain